MRQTFPFLLDSRDIPNHKRYSLNYHTAQGCYRIRGSLREAEAALPAAQFARCNASFLVNLRHVKAIEKENVVVGDERVKMSRGKRLEFMERFTRYLGGMGP